MAKLYIPLFVCIFQKSGRTSGLAVGGSAHKSESSNTLIFFGFQFKSYHCRIFLLLFLHRTTKIRTAADDMYMLTTCIALSLLRTISTSACLSFSACACQPLGPASLDLSPPAPPHPLF